MLKHDLNIMSDCSDCRGPYWGFHVIRDWLFLISRDAWSGNVIFRDSWWVNSTWHVMAISYFTWHVIWLLIFRDYIVNNPPIHGNIQWYSSLLPTHQSPFWGKKPKKISPVSRSIKQCIITNTPWEGLVWGGAEIFDFIT